MARALQDIITELNTVYNPQRDNYNKQIKSIDPALDAEQQGLNAQKEDSFRQITDQANRRGMFYSGLPIAEEQRYVGTQFLPAIANLRAKYSAQRFGLQDAIAKVTADQYNQAYNVRQKEVEHDAMVAEQMRREAEARRQFDAQLAAQRDAAARASSGGGGGGGGGYSFGGGGGSVAGASTRAAGPAVPQGLQTLYNQVFVKPGGGFWSDADLRSDYNATRKSAGYGNAADKQKLLLYHSVRPDLFGSSVPASGAFSNRVGY